MKLVKKLAALFAATTALAFSSCNNLGLDENSFQNKVQSYFLDMTSSAAVALYEIAPDDTVKNRAGVDCVPASGEHVVSFYLRNPQKYRFTLYDNMHFSVGGMIMEEGSGVSIAQDPNDTAKINITYSQEYLLEHPLGEDISPSVELFHPVSHASFGVFNKMNISSDSPPPSVQLACFQRDGATENDHYVVCFYLPDITKFANSYSSDSSEGKTDVHTFYINGTKKYLNIADKKIYNSATVDDEGNWTFTDEDTSIKGQSDKPDHLGPLNPTDPDAFVFTGTEADYQSAYVAKYMTLPETIGYYGDSEVTYNFTLEDDAGLAAGMTTSNKATRLTPPILLNAEDGAEIESGTDATHCRSYAADEESMYFTLRIVHNGKDAEDRPCGSVKINYTIKEINGERVFGGNDTLIGTANGSATLKLPKGKYDIQATASKDYYITSLKKEAEYVQVTKPAVYYVSQTGDDHDPGSKAQPYKTVQCAVNAFDDGIRYGEYPSDGICTIYVMTDLIAEDETSFTDDDGTPGNKSLVAIGGTSYAATVNIIGYGGTRTIDANGEYLNTDSAKVHRVMRVDGGHLVLENINLAGGYSTIDSISIGNGMGLMALNSGTTVKYTGGSVYNNDTYRSEGAGMYIQAAKVEMQDVTIRDNGKRLEVQGANGLRIKGAADVTMTNCNVIDNGVSEVMNGAWSFAGSGISFSGSGAKLYIKGGLIKGNKTRVGGTGGVPDTGISCGGGIYFWYGELTLEGVTITGNESYNGGAGIYQQYTADINSSLTIKGGAGGVKTTIYDNYATGTTTQSNVYIETDSETAPTAYRTIRIDGNIGQSKIGVSVPFTDTFKPAAGEPMVFTNGYNYLTTNAKKPGEVFFAENSYGIAFGSGPYEKEAAFAVSSASSYNATDYTFTPTLSEAVDQYAGMYPGATKTFTLNETFGSRKEPAGTPAYSALYLKTSDSSFYTMSGSTKIPDPTGAKATISAALYSGGTKVRDATVDSSDASRITLVAKTAGNAAALPPNNYTLKIIVEFLGATHEANIPIAIDYSAETVADYIGGLTTAGDYSVKVVGTVGPRMNYDSEEITTGDDGLAKVAKAIKGAAENVMIKLDARETSYVPAEGSNPLANYNNNSYFAGCANLKEMYLPDWMKWLVSRYVEGVGYEGLFQGCAGLTKIEIPDTVTTVLQKAFYHCSNLQTIEFGGTVEEWKEVEFYTDWRAGVYNVTKVVCSDGDAPFGFLEIRAVYGGTGTTESKLSHMTNPVSGNGTESDPYLFEPGTVDQIAFEYVSDGTTTFSPPSGKPWSVGYEACKSDSGKTLMHTARVYPSATTIEDWGNETRQIKMQNDRAFRNLYFKIMPVTTAAVPEGFVTVEGSTVVGGNKFMDTDSNAGVFVEGRSVAISTFWICDHEVTQAEYHAVMGTNPSNFSSSPSVGEDQENRPVEKVSWYDALVYCNKKSIAEDLEPCYTINGKTNPDEWGAVPTSSDDTWNAAICDFTKNGYRLPTEAEWEYAARGGKAGCEAANPTDWAGTDDSAELGKYAWYTSNSGSKTHEVKTNKVSGTDSANSLGIYDMSGNVFEWCWDWFASSIDASTPATGALSGYARVNHGGSWQNDASACSVAFRNNDSPYGRVNNNGFRVVRTAPNP